MPGRIAEPSRGGADFHRNFTLSTTWPANRPFRVAKRCRLGLYAGDHRGQSLSTKKDAIAAPPRPGNAAASMIPLLCRLQAAQRAALQRFSHSRARQLQQLRRKPGFCGRIQRGVNTCYVPPWGEPPRSAGSWSAQRAALAGVRGRPPRSRCLCCVLMYRAAGVPSRPAATRLHAAPCWCAATCIARAAGMVHGATSRPARSPALCLYVLSQGGACIIWTRAWLVCELPH